MHRIQKSHLTFPKAFMFEHVANTDRLLPSHCMLQCLLLLARYQLHHLNPDKSFLPITARGARAGFILHIGRKGQLLGIRAEGRSYPCSKTWHFLHHTVNQLPNGKVSFVLYFSYFIVTFEQATRELSSEHAFQSFPSFCSIQILL